MSAVPVLSWADIEWLRMHADIGNVPLAKQDEILRPQIKALEAAERIEGDK